MKHEDLDSPIWEGLEHFREMLNACEGRVKTAGLSALNHISKAYKILEIDPQMACFRAICAEEEAATSLLVSLRNQGYPFSDQYQLYSHPNKAGVAVFIKAVVRWYKETFLFETLAIHPPVMSMTDEPGRPAIELIIKLKGADVSFQPRPPLDIRVDGEKSMKEIIGGHLRDALRKKLASEVRGVIDVKANERNKLLYASDKTLPGCFNDPRGYILNQAAIVNALITAVGLIDPWRSPNYGFAGLVEAALEEYAHIMKSGRKNRP